MLFMDRKVHLFILDFVFDQLLFKLQLFISYLHDMLVLVCQ
jgi:hypothetical protein